MTRVGSGRVRDVYALKLYSRVARLGSFSAAAKECGLSQSQSSRIIADLETALGARLLSRTTRAVVPTKAGWEFLSRIEPILVAIDDAEGCVREGGNYRGLVRVSMPTSIGLRDAIPHLSGFAAKHAELHIQLLLDDKRHDLVREAIDVAIRVGRQADSSVAAQLIATIPRVIVASPGYVNRQGAPSSPGDLSKHRIVAGPAAAPATAWKFERRGDTATVDLEPSFSTNQNEGAVAAAVAGFGITSTSAWSCRRELEDGTLVRLLSDWKTVELPVFAFFPAGRATRAVGRALVEHLRAGFRRNQETVFHSP